MGQTINTSQTNKQSDKANMSVTKETELIGMKKASEAVACTLKEMRNYAQPGMTTKQLDNYGVKILSHFGAKSAPYLTYGFPGWTCISVNNEFATYSVRR